MLCSRSEPFSSQYEPFFEPYCSLLSGWPVAAAFGAAGVHAAVVAVVAPAVEVVRIAVLHRGALRIVLLFTAFAVHLVCLVHNRDF